MWLYINIIVPANSPVHLDIALNIDRDPEAKDDGVVWPEFYNDATHSVRLVPIEVTVKSESLGKAVTLYDPIYVVWGSRVIPQETDKEAFKSNFDKAVDLKAGKRSISFRQSLDYRFVTELIGYGRILNSSTLNPGQTLQGGRIIPVPTGTYDFLQIRVIIPSGVGQKGTTETSKAMTPSLLLSRPTQTQNIRVTQFIEGDLLVSYRIDKQRTLANTLFCNLSENKSEKELDNLPCNGNIVTGEDTVERGLRIYSYTKEIWLDNV
jgi:hypothetical protein